VAKQNITLYIQAKTLMARTLRSVKSDLAKLGSFGAGVGTFLRRGFVLAAAGVATLAAGFVYSMKLIKEQEDADVRLDNVLSKVGDTIGYTRQELMDYAKQLQKTTTVSDETAQSIIAMLAATGKVSGAELKRATEAVIDTVVMLDKADWKRTAKGLAAALQDPAKAATALSQAGIELSETEELNIKRMVRLGRASEVTALMLKKLEDTYGGVARAQRRTISGGYAGLKNQISDAMQEAAVGFARGMNWQEVFGRMEGKVGAFAERIGKIMEPIGQRVGDMLGKMFDADPKVRAAGNMMFGAMMADAWAAVAPYAKSAGSTMGEAFIETAKAMAPAWMQAVKAGGKEAAAQYVSHTEPGAIKRRAMVGGYTGTLTGSLLALRNFQSIFEAAGAAYGEPGATPNAPLYVQEVRPISGVMKP
jgi:hypothetical protein